MAQSVERRIGSAEVTGPIPVSSSSVSFKEQNKAVSYWQIRFCLIRYLTVTATISYAAVAQSVERRIGSAEVTGPIPVSSFSSISEESEVLFSSWQ